VVLPDTSLIPFFNSKTYKDNKMPKEFTYTADVKNMRNRALFYALIYTLIILAVLYSVTVYEKSLEGHEETMIIVMSVLFGVVFYLHSDKKLYNWTIWLDGANIKVTNRVTLKEKTMKIDALKEISVCSNRIGHCCDFIPKEGKTISVNGCNNKEVQRFLEDSLNQLGIKFEKHSCILPRGYHTYKIM
jgi:hypothetical protein